ncbi:MAG: hypothetical protein E3J67_04155, partial [Dehalococcoidia bacterium]
MKGNKIFRILSLAVILSMLVMVLPAAPALAAKTIDLDPEEGEIGDYFYVDGDGFPKSDDSEDPPVESEVDIYLVGGDEPSTSDDIDSDVNTFEHLKYNADVDEDGEFRDRVKVPSVLNDGDDDEDVTRGTYWVCVTYADDDRIRAVAEFTVLAAGIELDDDDGPVGTEVEITGTDFNDREDITVEYDDEDITDDIVSGDDRTSSNGGFITTIAIPESIAGDHTITVTDETGSSDEATFTVDSQLTIDPQSGAAGDSLTASGTG